nr:MAG TPA: hypothetical protein [Bacteriophage sp.]
MLICILYGYSYSPDKIRHNAPLDGILRTGHAKHMVHYNALIGGIQNEY